MTVTMHPSRTSGSVPGRFQYEDLDPNLETANRTGRLRLQVLGVVVLLSVVVLLILGMRDVEAIPTPSPMDARTELTTTVPDSVPSHSAGDGTSERTVRHLPLSGGLRLDQPLQALQV